MTPLRLAAILIALLMLGDAAQADRRAFIVGIAQYASLRPLQSPVFDAKAFDDLIKSHRFKTTFAESPGRDDLITAWQTFLNSVEPDDEVVIFYSGHGIEIAGQNFLVPADAPAPANVLGEVQLKSKLFPMVDLLSELQNREVRAGILILDACRDNPYDTGAKTVGSKAGLKDPPSKPPGTFILYSADYGQQSRDRAQNDPPSEQLSVFTRVLLRMVRAHPKTPINVLATMTKAPVLQLAQPHRQVPAYYDGLMDLWCFDECATSVREAKAQRVPTIAELFNMSSFTESMKNGQVMAAYPMDSLDTQVFSEFLTARKTALALNRPPDIFSTGPIWDSEPITGGKSSIIKKLPEWKNFGTTMAPPNKQPPKDLPAQWPKTTQDMTEALRKAQAELESELKRAAVFLGRRTMIDDCKNQNAQSVPFGCEQTRTILLGDYLAKSFKAEAEVTVMRRLPSKTSPGCVVKRIPKGEPIVFSRVYSLSAGTGKDAETAYWATIAGYDNEPCLRSAAARPSTP